MNQLLRMDIFQVEDNEDFSFLMVKAIEQIDKTLSLKVVDNGLTALEILKHCEKEGTRPGIILLDLNLPGLSGLDLLREV